MTSSARDGTKASVLTYHRIIEAFKFGFAGLEINFFVREPAGD